MRPNNKCAIYPLWPTENSVKTSHYRHPNAQGVEVALYRRCWLVIFCQLTSLGSQFANYELVILIMYNRLNSKTGCVMNMYIIMYVNSLLCAAFRFTHH